METIDQAPQLKGQAISCDGIGEFGTTHGADGGQAFFKNPRVGLRVIAINKDHADLVADLSHKFLDVYISESRIDHNEIRFLCGNSGESRLARRGDTDHFDTVEIPQHVAQQRAIATDVINYQSSNSVHSGPRRSIAECW